MRGTAARKDCTSNRGKSWKAQCLLPCAKSLWLAWRAGLILLIKWHHFSGGRVTKRQCGEGKLSKTDGWKDVWSAADLGWQSFLPTWSEFKCQDCKAISTDTWRGNRNASLTATIRVHCRWKTFWAMVKIWSHDTWAISKKEGFLTLLRHALFPQVNYTLGGWEGILSGHGGMCKHLSHPH